MCNVLARPLDYSIFVHQWTRPPVSIHDGLWPSWMEQWSTAHLPYELLIAFLCPSILFNQIHLFSVPLPCMQVTAGAYTTTVTNTCHLWHLRQQRRRSSNFNQITNKNLATANRPTAHHLRKQHVDSINSNPVTLNSRLTVTQGHWNCYHSKA